MTVPEGEAALGGFRFDRMTDSWVGVVPVRRAAWRDKARGGGLPKIRTRCPFCPGHEADTERTIARHPAEGAWEIRVVPNRYPLVTTSANPTASPEVAPLLDEPLLEQPLLGWHEVVVESNEHEGDLADFSEPHVLALLRIYRDRAKELAADPNVADIHIYRNRGRRAGASQPHPHGQLVTTSIVGPEGARRFACAEKYFREAGETLLTTEIASASQGGRTIQQADGFVSLCPYAPHFNHQVWVAPVNGSGPFWALDDECLAPLAQNVLRTARALRAVTGDRDYNIVWRNPPVGQAHLPSTFWYLDLMPRGGGGAGFELGSGIDCVVVLPVEAAKEMREAIES